jgi:hypothetical protein
MVRCRHHTSIGAAVALGAVLLVAAAATPLTTAAAAGADEPSYRYSQGTFVSSAQIRRFKAALRLTAEQEQYWPPVAAALRHVRLRRRSMAAANEAVRLWALVAAAKPLFDTLNVEQKRVARRLVEALGFGAFIATL